MHIGIDARFLQGPNTGVTNYLRNLLRSISEIDKHNSYTIFLSDPTYNGQVPMVSNFQTRVNSSNALFWKNIWLPRELRRLKIDLVHFPAYTGTFVNIGTNIVTIHDLIHKVNPKWFSYKELLLMELPVKLAIKKATGIIAVSESTKRDIMKYYKVKEQMITVTLEAADSTFRPVNDTFLLDKVKRKYAFDTEFILYVGVLFKRRNIPRLLEAFSLLKQNKNIHQRLVIAGPQKSYFNLNEYIKRYGLEKEIIYLGYVPQEDMPLLYNAASFFVYPSLYEGFGLPVLEAMSCGKAVITTNVSSLPEIIGDTGITVSPCDTKELYDAMYRLATDAPLREKLGSLALERSKIFNWNKMAKKSIEVYEKLAS